MTSPVIQFKRGNFVNLPPLEAGEPALTLDTFEFYIGINSTSEGNKFFGSHRYWTRESSSTGSGVNLVEGTTNGSNYLTLKSPDSLAGVTTYTFPAAPQDGYFLKTNASGQLEWANVSAGASFSGATLDNTSFSGISTFSGAVEITDTTSSTDENTGALIVDGGVGIAENLNVGGNLNVSGVSTFVGSVTFEGGTINLGDSTGDDINVGGEFISGLYPNTSNAYDLGDDTRQWRNANFAGVVTATTFSGALTGTASTATTVDTTATSTNASYFVPFVDTLAGQTGETLRIGIGLSVNPSTGAVGVTSTLSVGNVNDVNAYIKAGGGSNAMYLYSNGDVSFQAKVITNSIRSSSDSSDAITLSGLDATFGRNVKVTGISTFNNVTVGGATTALMVEGNTRIIGILTVGSASVTFSGVNNQIAGVTTFTGFADLNQGINVDGHTELDELNVSGVTTTGTLRLSGTSGIGITAISADTGLIEDSDDYLATQKAVKAYVDAQVTATNLDFGGDSGTGSVDLDSESLTVAGTINEIVTSGAGTTLTIGLPNDVTVTTSLTTPTVKATDIQANDGTSSITISNGNGNVGISSNLTVSGNLFVNGSTTQVNTTTLTVEDTLVEIGLVNGNAPNSDVNIDLGILFNYYTSSAKKAAVYWDDSAERIAIASEVTEANSVLTANAYAALEIGALWVNDCAGQSQVISCAAGVRTLQNITIDAGTF